MAITKKDLLDMVNDNIGIPKNDCVKLVESALEIIKAELEKSRYPALANGLSKRKIPDRKSQEVHAEAKKIGPPLIFERLWRDLGIGKTLKKHLGSRKYGFDVERAIFLTVLHRLFISGSDRACDKWRRDYRIEGVEDLSLHHLYRAMAFLGG